MHGGDGGPSGARARVMAAGLLALAAPAWPIQLDGGPLGHWTVGGWTEGYAVFRVDHDTQHQHPQGIVALDVTGDIHPKARFFLDARTTFGGPPEHTDGLGIINMSDTFQNVSPAVEIEEGYFDLFLPSLDVRLGKQKFAWGKLDTFQPTDVVNPRRFNDPFVTDGEDRKIGIPAVRASYFPPALGTRWPQDVSGTLVWVPVPVPPRFPLEDERWFPSSTSVPSTLRVPGSLLGKDVPDLVTQNELTTANRRPAQQLDEGAVGLRLAGLWGRADWALYYYGGPETALAFDFNTTLVALGPRGTFLQCVAQGPSKPCLRSDSVLRPISGRITLAGGDVAVEAGGGFTVRAEGAWSANRFLPRTVQDLVSTENLSRVIGGPNKRARTAVELNLGHHVPVDLGNLFVRRDTVDWGVGIDYRYRGFTPVLQVNQTLVLDNTTNLLVSNVDTHVFFVVRKPWLADRLQTDVGVVQGFERSYTTGVARATYSITDHWRVRLGYLLIAGTRNTEIGQFHDNDEGYVQLRYSY